LIVVGNREKILRYSPRGLLSKYIEYTESIQGVVDIPIEDKIEFIDP